MKKIKIISVIGAVALLLLMNFSIISSNGKVEEMYVAVNPELSIADGQCRFFELFCDCCCDMGTYYCLLAHCTGGIICAPDVEVNE